jgi:hypothetical protein
VVQVHALIAFFSTGYPMEKVEEYIRLRRPFLVNDLESQKNLWDRRKVYFLQRPLCPAFFLTKQSPKN